MTKGVFGPSSEPVNVIVHSVLDGLHGSVSKKVVEAILKSFELCQRISLSDRSLTGVPVDEEVLGGIAKLCIGLLSFATASMIDVLDGRLIHGIFFDFDDGAAFDGDDCAEISRPLLPSSSLNETPFSGDYHFHSGKPIVFLQKAPGMPYRRGSRLFLTLISSCGNVLSRREREAVLDSQKRRIATSQKKVSKNREF